jgi:hypothetical protein
MTLDATEVRVGVEGHLYVAPLGTTMPTDVTTALAAAWVELGYTETGPSMSVDTEREDFVPWQSKNPVRSVVTGQTMTSTFTLWQRNSDTLKLAFGGGTVTLSGAGPAKLYTPPPAGLDERAFVYEIIDGTTIDRYLLYRGVPALGGEVSFNKDAVSGFEIEITHLESADGTWKLITNDANVVVDS